MKNKFKGIEFPILSALLICLSFPKWNFEISAWFALTPLFFAIEHFDFRKSFFYGWLTGALASCGILYWIIPTFQAAEVHLLIGIAALLLLASYIGLYYGLYTAISQTFFKSFPEPIHIFLCMTLWVALEYLRGHFFTGFPWLILGYSQWKFYPILQICEWTGVYGISAILLAGNLILYSVIRKKKVNLPSLLLLFIPVTFSFFLFTNQKEYVLNPSVRIAVLQGNIDQYKKWSAEFVDEILQSYKTLTEKTHLQSQIEKKEIDLVVWPETSVPGWIPEQKELMDWIKNVIRKTKSNHLIGAVTQTGRKNFNSAFLFDQEGKMTGRYDKIHLVPFGEFVPFQSWLEPWIPVLNQLGGFDSGNQKELLQIPKSKFAANICYEAIFPELVRKEVLKGAEFIVNITNDGWYLDTAAPEQHFSMNVFRAIENRRTVVRSANTGISGFINPDGSIIKNSGIGEKVFMIENIFLNDQNSFYTKYGDCFAWSCILISLSGFLISLFFKRKLLKGITLKK